MDPEYLRQRLRYDPETGKLWWRAWPPHGASWNTRFAGREAFLVKHRQGYLRGCVDDQRLYAHCVIWAIVHGVWPEEEIDHEDHDQGNNRIGNLRERTKAANMRNMPKLRSNTSGVTGVYWHKATGKWVAKIRVNRRLLHLGYHDDLDAAVRRRQEAEREHDFDTNHGQ